MQDSLRAKRMRALNRRSQDRWVWLALGAFVVANAALVASLWPYARRATQAQAKHFIEAGNHEQGRAAELKFEMARLLDPANHEAATYVATQLIAAGEPERAIQILNRATRGQIGESAMVASLYTHAYLEVGDNEKAAQAASELARLSSDESQLVLASLAYLATGKPEQAKTLMPRITAPEALQRVVSAGSHKLALGRELFASGLLRSSQRILITLPDSLPRNLILGSLALAHPTPESLATALTYYEAAVGLDPSNQEARRGLVAALEGLHDDVGVAKQRKLLGQLQTGRP